MDFIRAVGTHGVGTRSKPFILFYRFFADEARSHCAVVFIKTKQDNGIRQPVTTAAGEKS